MTLREFRIQSGYRCYFRLESDSEREPALFGYRLGLPVEVAVLVPEYHCRHESDLYRHQT